MTGILYWLQLVFRVLTQACKDGARTCQVLLIKLNQTNRHRHNPCCIQRLLGLWKGCQMKPTPHNMSQLEVGPHLHNAASRWLVIDSLCQSSLR